MQHTIVRSAALLVVGILAGLATRSICCDFPPKGLLEQPRAEFRGGYVNAVYRYSVNIPAELTGYSAPAPAPQHGFGLILGNHDNAYIDVDAERNSLELLTPFDAALNFLSILQREHKNIETVNITRSTLDRIEAFDVVVIYMCPGESGRYSQSAVVTLSPDRENVYSITLYSAAPGNDGARALFHKILKSWRYRPPSTTPTG